MEFVNRYHGLCKCDFVAPNYCARCRSFIRYMARKHGLKVLRQYIQVDEEGRLLDAMTREQRSVWFRGGEITKH